MKQNISRRTLLQILGVAGGVSILRHVASDMRLAHAEVPNSNLLLVAYMSGGWDQLLALDPRDNTDPRFQDAAARRAGGSGICPAYDIVSDTDVKAVLASNATGVQKAGNLTFGPAVPQSLMAHYDDLAICRGVSMDTLTHEVGRRYLLTGKFPRGLAASGSAMTTLVASAAGGTTLLPNLAVSTESYNEGMPSFATATTVRGAADLQTVLRPLGTPLDPASGAALEAFQAASDTCAVHEFDQQRKMTILRELTQKSHLVAKSSASSLFQFNLTNPSPDVAPLFSAMGIQNATDLASARGRAAIAAQALARGVSTAVSVELADDLDDHFDWDVDHATKLRTGLDALGRLIAYLKSQPHRDGGSVWSRTTLLVYSEFSRTPLLNSRAGRDHHLSGSVLLAGPKIRGNQVIGASSDKQTAAQPIDMATGLVDQKGAKLRPSDIHATLLTSMGMSLEPIQNQNPSLIAPLLK